jgi:nicotinate-nucleotide adenylyltransferase
VRIGILGGTFDPPHTGHLIAAQDCLIRLRLDRVDFVPARQPPHKRSRPVSPAPVRVALLSAALADDDRFRIDHLELDRQGPSWTVDTLRAYRARDADAELFLLVGMDQYVEFATWREPEEIARLATIVVMARAGEAPTGEGITSVAVTRIDISSTEIRDRVGRGESIRYLVPAGVEQIIADQKLYRRGAEPAGVAVVEAAPNRPGSAG